MGLTHGVRNLVVGSALTAGAMGVMQGAAAAEEGPSPTDSSALIAAPRPADEQAAEGRPTTVDDEEHQPPLPPSPRLASTSAPGTATVEAETRATAAEYTAAEVTAAEITTAQITTPGPLTRVQTGPDLNCAVSHAADKEPAFFEDAACGTFLAADGTLFGPDVVRPTSIAPRPRSIYTRLRQSTARGSGSFTDPYKVVTEVGLGATGLSITQTDSYVAGQESYRTDVTVANAGPGSRTARLYRAGDCVVGDVDDAFGSVDAATGAVACVGGEERGDEDVSTPRIQQWFPMSPDSHYYADGLVPLWGRIGSQLPFPDLCQLCTSFRDNAAGLSWDITVPAGGSVTRSHLTTFSLLGVMPVTISTIPRAPAATPGSVVTYTVVLTNTNRVTVKVNSIVDILPAGFSYVPGSTSGVMTLDPTVTGQILTWTGPFEVSPSSQRAMEFRVRVADVPGDYMNEAGADAGPYAVAPMAGSAAITVVGLPGVVAPPAAPTVGGVEKVRPAANALVPLAPGRIDDRPLVAPRPAGTLPATGSDPQNLLVLATLLLVGGGALVTAGRRPRPNLTRRPA
jgi:uncharacterized repeat protein (TIGR01451 family)/LPXTG-motif cell wall-anchored protein